MLIGLHPSIVMIVRMLAAVSVWLWYSSTGGQGDGMFGTLKLDWETFAHTSPLCQFSETEPWDRPALIARQLMSTLDLRESLGIMWRC